MSSENSITLARLYVPYCQHNYGQLPCTASGDIGTECFNSFATCQDKANFAAEPPGSDGISLRHYRLIDEVATNTTDSNRQNGYPVIKRIKQTSELIKRGQGLAVRGGVDIICTDSVGPQVIRYEGLSGRSPDDKYIATRGKTPGASFFSMLKARYPYYNRYPIDVRFQRYDAGGVLRRTNARYFLETIQGPDERGQVTLRCRDILTSVDADTAQLPGADNATLAVTINPTITTVQLSGFEAPNFPVSGGHLVIEDELISYASRSGNTLSGCVRGVGSTIAASHTAGERAIAVKYYAAVNVVDVLYELLTVYAGIDPAYIPYTNGADPTAQWDREKDSYLAGHQVTRIIAEPTGVAKLIDEVCEQCHISLYTDSLDPYQINLSAINSAQASLGAVELSEEEIIAGSLKIIERPKRMISQSWIYHNPRTVLETGRPSDYDALDIEIDTELESPNAWGKKRVTAILGSWLRNAGNIAILTNDRIINERSTPQYEAVFVVDWDRYDNNAGAPDSTKLRLGGYVNLLIDSLQSADGTPIPFTWQIIKAEWDQPMVTVRLTAATVRPRVLTQLRFGNIVNVANENTEYSAASDPDKALWGWIAESNAGFPDGGEPYLMT